MIMIITDMIRKMEATVAGTWRSTTAIVIITIMIPTIGCHGVRILRINAIIHLIQIAITYPITNVAFLLILIDTNIVIIIIRRILR